MSTSLASAKSMHICSVITSFTTGGAETLVCNLARHFVEAGHDASILALCDASAVGNSPKTEAEMIERLHRQNIFAMSLGLDRKRSMLKGRRALVRWFEAMRPDILHLHTARAALMAGLAQPKVPLILTHHNSRLSFPRHLYRLFDQFVYSYVGISEACASQTRTLARRPVRLIVNGAEVHNASGSARIEPRTPPTIIAVGAISDQKNYPLLIAAANRLVPRLQAFNLKIVGGGEELTALKELVSIEGLQNHVHLLGVRHDVPELLKSADLFVNSSKYEGMSVAMLEGLMSALPVVATKVPGNTELVRHLENGLLVPQSDPDALASAIADLLLDAPLYGKLSQGAVTSSKAFTLERCAQEHLKLYDDAIAFASRRKAA